MDASDVIGIRYGLTRATMQNRTFPLGLYAVFLGFIGVLVACAAGEPVQASPGPDTILSRLTVSDASFLDLLEPTEQLVEEIRREKVSGPYSLARAYEARGLPESARIIYRIEMENGVSPWSGRSAARLALLAAREERWLLAEGYAQRGIELLPENHDLWYRHGEALYRAERYRELLELTDRMPDFTVPGKSGEGEVVTLGELYAERLLWRAVASYHLDEESVQRFQEAFVRVPAQDVHSRLYLFLFYRSDVLPRYPADIRHILEFVYRSAVGEHREARRLFLLIDPDWIARMLVEEAETGTPGIAAVLQTLLQSVESGDREVERRLETVQEAIAGDRSREAAIVRSELLFVRGRYAEARGDREAALERIGEAIGHRRSDSPRSDFVREWIQTAIRAAASLPDVLDALIGWQATESDYALAVDRLLPVMIRERRWEDVVTVYLRLPPEAEESRAQLAVVTAILARDGHIERPADADRRLAEASERSVVSYYGLLARRLTDERVVLSDGQTVDTERADEGSGEMKHAAALLAAGQPEAARRFAMALTLDPENASEALQLALQLYDLGHVSAALDLARRAIVRGRLPVRERDIRVLYPQPYPVEIRAAAAEYGVRVPILYGLIREESHFNPRAQSPVGAVGLAQVMPATAEDLIRRLGWLTADLERVSDNVRMGAYYLDYLAGLLPEKIILQLASYNAGPGRGRTWNTSFGDLSPELQIEAVPFIETRWYLRRIAVSSAWYQYQTEDTDPAQANLLFQ